MTDGLFDTTICAPATGSGGAISVIRVSGPKAIEVTDSIFTPSSGGSITDAAGYTLHYGTIRRAERIIDDVVVSVFRAPASYTGENSTEISCHGSQYIVGEVIALLLENGAIPAGAGEFTKRAFLSGKMDLAQAEAVADVIAAENEAAHRVAISQMKGGFSRELSEMRAALLHIASLMELELDFSEEEVEFADRTELRNLLDAAISRIGSLVASFRLGNAIKTGIPVAIVGATNSGKSTLLNALIGEDRAIVSDIAGTTRDTVEETFVIDGMPFRFIDTAGIRETDEVIEKIGIERSFKALANASVVLGVIDGTLPPADFNATAESIASHITEGQHLILLRNKIDIAGKAFDAEGATADSDNDCARNRTDNSSAAWSAFCPTGTTDAGADAAANCCLSGIADVTAQQCLDISAASGEGLDALRSTLTACIRGEISGYASNGNAGQDNCITSQLHTAAGNRDAVLVTNARHAEALKAASAALTRVRQGLDNTPALPTDLLTQDLREALYHLGSITGEISTDEILGNIFRNFCIGK